MLLNKVHDNSARNIFSAVYFKVLVNLLSNTLNFNFMTNLIKTKHLGFFFNNVLF